MALADAKKYIRELHKRQNDPFLWPDFLTGLPDKAAIIRKLEEASPKIGQYAVAYVRIANIRSYLIKYGPDHHADVIQWTAAILKTTADTCRKGFVGTLGTHDFLVICEGRELERFMTEAAKLFQKQMRNYYSARDLKNRTTLAYREQKGKDIKIGLMHLIAVIADRKLPVKRGDLILNMARVCDALENSDDDMIFMTRDMICRD